MAAPGKQYGLILSQKKAASKTLQRPSIFGDDSDEETSVGESLQKEAVKKRMMKQTRLEMHKALEQDSTVYDYDGVYDDIQNQRLESSKKMLGGADRKPKYINQLMKAVEERKKEQERRDERKIQKEREAEGEEFADKEAYVTAAYRQKLKERKEEQEKEKREEEMEAALDVKKQKDLSGFYRHLLNQTVGEEAIPDGTTDQKQSSAVVKGPEGTPAVESPPSRDNAVTSPSDSEDGRDDNKPGFSKPGLSSGHSKRQYRQRSPSSGSGDERGRDKAKERGRHKKSRSDRDRRSDRDGEREDRHRGRDDRDRRKERERENDQHRGSREERGKEGRPERSPKERRRDEAKKEKRKSPGGEEEKEEKRKSPGGEEKEKEAEERKNSDKEREVEPEGKEERGKGDTQEESSSKQGPDGPQSEGKESKFAKRSSDQTVSSARERYLARRMERSACKAYIEKEED